MTLKQTLSCSTLSHSCLFTWCWSLETAATTLFLRSVSLSIPKEIVHLQMIKPYFSRAKKNGWSRTSDSPKRKQCTWFPEKHYWNLSDKEEGNVLTWSPSDCIITNIHSTKYNAMFFLKQRQWKAQNQYRLNECKDNPTFRLDQLIIARGGMWLVPQLRKGLRILKLVYSKP